MFATATLWADATIALLYFPEAREVAKRHCLRFELVSYNNYANIRYWINIAQTKPVYITRAEFLTGKTRIVQTL